MIAPWRKLTLKDERYRLAVGWTKLQFEYEHLGIPVSYELSAMCPGYYTRACTYPVANVNQGQSTAKAIFVIEEDPSYDFDDMLTELKSEAKLSLVIF